MTSQMLKTHGGGKTYEKNVPDFYVPLTTETKFLIAPIPQWMQILCDGRRYNSSIRLRPVGTHLWMTSVIDRSALPNRFWASKCLKSRASYTSIFFTMSPTLRSRSLGEPAYTWNGSANTSFIIFFWRRRGYRLLTRIRVWFSV